MKTILQLRVTVFFKSVKRVQFYEKIRKYKFISKHRKSFEAETAVTQKHW